MKKSTKKREAVNGVRRIWGTLKSASAHTVKNTIIKLSKRVMPTACKLNTSTKPCKMASACGQVICDSWKGKQCRP